MSSSRQQKPLRVVSSLLLLALLVALVATSLARYSRSDKVRDLRARRSLAQTYQGFDLQALRFSEKHFWNSNITFDGGSYSGHWFEMESTDVPGFKVRGNYYLSLENEPYDWTARTGLFDGKTLTRQQAIALERLWVSLYPTVTVNVGDDAYRTGVVTYRLLENDRVSPKYSDIPMDEVFSLDGAFGGIDRVSGDFFRIDPRSGKWVRIGDYLEPPSQQ